MLLCLLRAGIVATGLPRPCANNPSALPCRRQKVDIVVSRGASNPEWLLCMGWVYVKSTPSTLEFLPVFLQRLEEVKDDQKAFNFVLLCGPPPRAAGWRAAGRLAAGC